MDIFQTQELSVYNYITMGFRNIPHLILILQMIRFALKGEMVPTPAVRYRITQ